MVVVRVLCCNRVGGLGCQLGSVQCFAPIVRVVSWMSQESSVTCRKPLGHVLPVSRLAAVFAAQEMYWRLRWSLSSSDCTPQIACGFWAVGVRVVAVGVTCLI